MTTDTRLERDSFGTIAVPNDALWGAQTQRSLENFAISTEKMPPELIVALARIKRAAAHVNLTGAVLPKDKANAIMAAASEIIEGQHAHAFPLSVWQTGSGTQSHMNVNEVIANRASELLGGSRGEARLVHPNDDVNRGQSSNDCFPSAINLAALGGIVNALLPSLLRLHDALAKKASAFMPIIKIGRTHLQDATPVRLGQEVSGWVAQLDHARRHIDAALPHLCELAIGGTAVGTGLNAPSKFGDDVARELSRDTRLPVVSAPNKFEALGAHDSAVHAHAALKGLACSLMKIANDIRWLASGPRAGLGELSIPENEPGSSIMPGKVNPTQCEALTMIAVQVLGNDVAISIAGASGNFELNVYRPLIGNTLLQSIRLLAQGMDSFATHCVDGIQPNLARIDELLHRSLMLVTALTPHIGYDKAAEIAKRAHAEGATLKDTAVRLGYVTANDFDAWVRPEQMV